MITNELFIVVSDLSLDWSTDYNYQTAKILSKQNTVIIWILKPLLLWKCFRQKTTMKIFYKYASNMYIFNSFFIFPITWVPFIRKINHLISTIFFRILLFFFQKGKKFNKIVFWTFTSNFSFHNYFLNRKKTFLIYDIIDYFLGNSSDKRIDGMAELKDALLLKHANIVTVNSHVLKRLYAKKHNHIYLVPQGFRYETFLEKSIQPPFIVPNDKPIIGFVGAINDRLDFSLLHNIAKQNPHCRFVFVGPVIEDNNNKGKITKEYSLLQSNTNVLVYPNVGKKYIPGIIQHFDICMIPYNISSDFNRYCFPMKLFEYFFMGKPVVSTPIEELKRFPKFVKIGKNAGEWHEHIQQLLKKPWPYKSQKEQKKLALANSWDKKVDTILNKIN